MIKIYNIIQDIQNTTDNVLKKEIQKTVRRTFQGNSLWKLYRTGGHEFPDWNGPQKIHTKVSQCEIIEFYTKPNYHSSVKGKTKIFQTWKF